MANFSEIEFRTDQKLPEFLISIHSSVKIMMVKDMFEFAFHVVARYVAAYPPPRPDIPEIRIPFRPEIYLEANEAVIYVSTLFIDECLDARYAPLHDLVVLQPSDPPLPYVLPNLYFAWSIAHEFFHGCRRHNLALEMTTNTPESQRAAEIDADLVAVAAVYRYLQLTMASTYSDMTIRQVIFASLFWTLRRLPISLQSTATHPGKAERIFLIYSKLANLRSNERDPADPSGVLPETRSNGAALSKHFARCEAAYRLDAPSDVVDFSASMTDLLDKQGWRDFTTSWAELRRFVEVASGTIA